MKWGYTWRELRRRPLRTTLTFLGIVIGVAALVSIMITVETTRRAYGDMYASLAGRAALEVRTVDDGGIDAGLVGTVKNVEGVRHAVPVVQIPAVLLGPKGRSIVITIGIDPAQDDAVRDIELRSGRPLAPDTDGVLLDAAFADANGLGVGDEIRLLTRTGGTRAPVAGLIEPGPTSAFQAGAIVLMPLVAAQQRFGFEGKVTAVQLVLEDDDDLADVRGRVADVIPPGHDVAPPAMRAAVTKETLASTEKALQSFSVMSLVAGAFIILNTFLMNLGERRRQLALLRALGATRGQVFRWLSREAFVLGVAGTLVGLACGWMMAGGMLRGMEGIMGTTLSSVRPGVLPFVLGGVLGPSMALLATFVPARRAGREPPIHGITFPRGDEHETPHRWAVRLGTVCLAVAAVVVVLFVGDFLDQEIAGRIMPFSMAVFITGWILVMPVILVPVMRWVAFLARPVMGLEGRVAARHLNRRRTRTALTSGVLFVAVVITIAFGNQIRSNLRDMDTWYDRTIVGDWFVRGAMPATALAAVPTIPESLESDLRAIEGVGPIRKLRFFPSTIEGVPVMVLTVDATGDAALPLDLVKGTFTEVLRGLRSGGIVIGSNLAHRLDKDRGDVLDLQTKDGPRAVPVVGTITAYTNGGMTAYASWATAKQLFGFKGVDVFCVSRAEDAPPDLDERLRALVAREGLLLQSNADLKESIDKTVGGVTGFMWTLLLLTFVVASLGTVNTLTMNVLEQTREIGVMRAVAMTRRQVKRVVRWQAFLLGIASLIPGLVVGLLCTVILHLTTYPLTGIPVAFNLDPAIIVTCSLLAPVTAVAAAVLPGRRAARMRVIQALLQP